MCRFLGCKYLLGYNTRNNNNCNIIVRRSLPYRTIYQILLRRPNLGWCDEWAVIAARGEVRNECLIIVFGKPEDRNLIGAIPLCCCTNWNIVQSKHNNIFNNVKLLRVSFTSNYYQADIFNTWTWHVQCHSMGSNIVHHHRHHHHHVNSELFVIPEIMKSVEQITRM